jgi:hypothetical protein
VSLVGKAGSRQMDLVTVANFIKSEGCRAPKRKDK